MSLCHAEALFEKRTLGLTTGKKDIGGSFTNTMYQYSPSMAPPDAEDVHGYRDVLQYKAYQKYLGMDTDNYCNLHSIK